MTFVNMVESEVLVIGGGLAGLYAALQAAPHAAVTLLSKGLLTVSNSMWAQGGIAAALAPTDSPAQHLADTLVAGRGLCARGAATVLVEEGPAHIRHLLAMGVPFDREPDGTLSLGLEGGHGQRRIVHAAGAATGAAVTAVVVEAVRREPSITLHEGMVAVELLEAEGSCAGVLAWHAPTGTWWAFHASATILAAGGAAALFARSTNPTLTRGDGVAMAWRTGAAIADLEFVQFHPTALVTPSGDSSLLSEAIRGEGAQLRNGRGERFMPHYHPLAELAPRDVVARAILSEMRATGAGHVWLDLSPIPAATVEHHFSSLIAHCATLGLDLRREPMPVAPAAHYVMGGVCTDLDGATTVPGLFACGEVACTGVQGANRLASNSLLECLVFGARSARAAVALARTARPLCPALPPVPTLDPTERAAADAHLGQRLWENAGLEREAAGLAALQADLEAQATRVRDHFSQSALQVARLIAAGAALRTESRGGHFRRDHPAEDEAWRQRIVFQKGQPPTRVGLEMTDVRQQTTDIRQQTTDIRQQTTDIRQQTTCYPRRGGQQAADKPWTEGAR